MTTTQHYYDSSGRERFLRTTNGAQTIQALAFQYDANSNLTSRSDLVGRTTEDFQYDERRGLRPRDRLLRGGRARAGRDAEAPAQAGAADEEAGVFPNKAAALTEFE